MSYINTFLFSYYADAMLNVIIISVVAPFEEKVVNKIEKKLFYFNKKIGIIRHFSFQQRKLGIVLELTESWSRCYKAFFSL